MNTAHLSSTKNTSPLAAFADQQIDWNLTPEMAVTLYLEWGNNDWRSEHPPVRSKSDVATYFVVDAWQDPLKVRLVRRNSESADDTGDCSAAGAAGESVPGRVRFPQGGL